MSARKYRVFMCPCHLCLLIFHTVLLLSVCTEDVFYGTAFASDFFVGYRAAARFVI